MLGRFSFKSTPVVNLEAYLYNIWLDCVPVRLYSSTATRLKLSFSICDDQVFVCIKFVRWKNRLSDRKY